MPTQVLGMHNNNGHAAIWSRSSHERYR